MKTEDKIRLGIVDNDRLVVDLLFDFLSKHEDLELCLKAHSGNDAMLQLSGLGTLPDVLIVDLKMEDGDGLELMAHLGKAYPAVRIITLSSFYRPSLMGFMLKTGTNAFLSKETTKEDLLTVIREVHSKGHYLNAEQVAVLREQITHKVPKPSVRSKDALSQRELEVLELICHQCTAKEIAERLFITIKTVESHKTSLLLKTDAKNSAGLIIYAIQNKLVNPDHLIFL